MRRVYTNLSTTQPHPTHPHPTQPHPTRVKDKMCPAVWPGCSSTMLSIEIKGITHLIIFPVYTGGHFLY